MTEDELNDRVEEAHGPTIKFELFRPGDGGEGLWGKIETKEDAELYEKDTGAHEITVLCMNQALIGGPTWGMRFTVTTRGTRRPVIHIDKFIEQCKAQFADYPKVQYGEEENPAEG